MTYHTFSNHLDNLSTDYSAKGHAVDEDSESDSAMATRRTTRPSAGRGTVYSTSRFYFLFDYFLIFFSLIAQIGGGGGVALDEIW